MGSEAWEAVIEATMHRFRPILLTAAAAILGMVPIAPTIFWGPMAYAIMGGLAVATVLTLVFLPALYVIWFRVERPREVHASELEATCSVDAAAILSQVSGLLGALIGGGASLAVAVYNQRAEERIQRVANEVTRRETVYADFLRTRRRCC